MMTAYKTRGFVLVTAMVLLLSVTIIAAALLSASSGDARMINAAQEASEAALFARGGNDETYSRAVNRSVLTDPDDPNSGVNIFTETANFPRTIATNYADTNSEIALRGLAVATDCPPSDEATDVATLGCYHFRVTTTAQFGDANVNAVQVESAVSQQVKR